MPVNVLQMSVIMLVNILQMLVNIFQMPVANASEGCIANASDQYYCKMPVIYGSTCQ